MNKIVNKIKEKLKKISYTTNQVASKAKDKISYTTKEKLTDAKDFTNKSLSPSLLPESSTITSTVIQEQSIVASREDLKNLELSDLVIMASLSYDFDKSFKYFFERDAFTLPDPFKDPENYLYYLFVEKNIWYKIMGNDKVMLDISHEQANEIKGELMPKDTNNFYPFRKDGKIVGCIMFA